MFEPGRRIGPLDRLLHQHKLHFSEIFSASLKQRGEKNSCHFCLGIRNEKNPMSRMNDTVLRREDLGEVSRPMLLRLRGHQEETVSNGQIEPGRALVTRRGPLYT